MVGIDGRCGHSGITWLEGVLKGFRSIFACAANVVYRISTSTRQDLKLEPALSEDFRSFPCPLPVETSV